jgi:hypothetical protein
LGGGSWDLQALCVGLGGLHLLATVVATLLLLVSLAYCVKASGFGWWVLGPRVYRLYV